MSEPTLYTYEFEFIFTGDYSDDAFNAYAGTADPVQAMAAVKDAIARMKTVMTYVACPTMSIRAITADGANVFKVTLNR